MEPKVSPKRTPRPGSWVHTAASAPTDGRGDLAGQVPDLAGLDDVDDPAVVRCDQLGDVAARHTIWKWAGVVDDVWGRLRVLWYAFLLASAVLGFVWYFAIGTFGVVGTVVLVLSALSLLIGAAGGIHALSLSREVAVSQELAHPQPAATQAPQLEAPSETQAQEFVFDEAPPELADMTAASLKEILAGRTFAQIDKLMEQHVGKSVRVSGEVEYVLFGATFPQVRLRSAVPLQLFFDDDDYDAESPLLTVNEGDTIVVTGRIYKVGGTSVDLAKCRLIEARRVS
jgi:hypothetical protein